MVCPANTTGDIMKYDANRGVFEGKVKKRQAGLRIFSEPLLSSLQNLLLKPSKMPIN